MKSNTAHLLGVLMLWIWGTVMLYFYGSGRIAEYLPPDGAFRPLVLIGGIGLWILGAFNLLTLGHEEAECDHDHSGESGCCDHHQHQVLATKSIADLSLLGNVQQPQVTLFTGQHGSSSAQEGQHACNHDHGASACCDHEHGSGHTHAEGLLFSGGIWGRMFAIFMLLIPVSYAAIRTPDRYSAHAVMNKGVYHQNYGSTTRAGEFSLRPTTPAEVADNKVAVTRPAPVVTPQTEVVIPTPAPDAIPAVQPQETKSVGSFTLADLEAQIPKSAEGNFMLEVPEIYYTASDAEIQQVLSGQSVETIAQILPEKDTLSEGKPRARIFRMMVQCCAADARPYSIPVEFDGSLPEFKDMSWVKISGVMSYEEQNGQRIPLIKVSGIVETAQPVESKMF